MPSQNIIKTYTDLYKLPCLRHKENVSTNFFELCQNDYSFVIMVIYNPKKEFLLFKDLDKGLGWGLVGGHIEKNENIEDAINRISLSEANCSIDELEPFAIVHNEFQCLKNKKRIVHTGIAFLALSRNVGFSKKINIKIVHSRRIPATMPYQDKKVLEQATVLLKNKTIKPPYNEVDHSKKNCGIKILNKIVKLIGSSASKKIKAAVLSNVDRKPSSIADVSCGDDKLLFALEKKYHPNLCVANDIAWQTICTIKNKKSKIIFTNHNILNLPYKKHFDLIIFKNTLHHIPKNKQGQLITQLASIARQLLVIDIENPTNSGFLSYIWHQYYVKILKDQGGNFLGIEPFQQVIQQNIGAKKVVFGAIKTIKGRYLYASIT